MSDHSDLNYDKPRSIHEIDKLRAEVKMVRSLLHRAEQEEATAILQLGEARRALEIIADLGPVDPATNAAKIGIDAVGVAVVALNKLRAPEKRIDDGSKCPACGRGVTGVDPLCDKHYSEYLGTNRARGNGPGD